MAQFDHYYIYTYVYPQGRFSSKSQVIKNYYIFLFRLNSNIIALTMIPQNMYMFY